MKDQIVLDSSLAKPLVDAARRRINEIDIEIEGLASEKNALGDLLKSLGEPEPPVVRTVGKPAGGRAEIETMGYTIAGDAVKRVSGYNPKATWWNKTLFALKYTNKPMTTADVVDFLAEIDHLVKVQRSVAVANISALLGRNAKFETSTLKRKKGITGEWEYELNENAIVEEVTLDFM